MPVEIREILIKAILEQEGDPATAQKTGKLMDDSPPKPLDEAKAEAEAPDNGTAESKDALASREAIIRECLRRVEEMLENRKYR